MFLQFFTILAIFFTSPNSTVAQPRPAGDSSQGTVLQEKQAFPYDRPNWLIVRVPGETVNSVRRRTQLFSENGFPSKNQITEVNSQPRKNIHFTRHTPFLETTRFSRNVNRALHTKRPTTEEGRGTPLTQSIIFFNENNVHRSNRNSARSLENRHVQKDGRSQKNTKIHNNDSMRRNTLNRRTHFVHKNTPLRSNRFARRHAQSTRSSRQRQQTVRQIRQAPTHIPSNRHINGNFRETQPHHGVFGINERRHQTSFIRGTTLFNNANSLQGRRRRIVILRPTNNIIVALQQMASTGQIIIRRVYAVSGIVEPKQLDTDLSRRPIHTENKNGRPMINDHQSLNRRTFETATDPILPLPTDQGASDGQARTKRVNIVRKRVQSLLSLPIGSPLERRRQKTSFDRKTLALNSGQRSSFRHASIQIEPERRQSMNRQQKSFLAQTHSMREQLNSRAKAISKLRGAIKRRTHLSTDRVLNTNQVNTATEIMQTTNNMVGMELQEIISHDNRISQPQSRRHQLVNHLDKRSNQLSEVRQETTMHNDQFEPSRRHKSHARISQKFSNVIPNLVIPEMSGIISVPNPHGLQQQFSEKDKHLPRHHNNDNVLHIIPRAILNKHNLEMEHWNDGRRFQLQSRADKKTHNVHLTEIKNKLHTTGRNILPQFGNSPRTIFENKASDHNKSLNIFQSTPSIRGNIAITHKTFIPVAITSTVNSAINNDSKISPRITHHLEKSSNEKLDSMSEKAIVHSRKSHITTHISPQSVQLRKINLPTTTKTPDTLSIPAKNNFGSKEFNNKSLQESIRNKQDEIMRKIGHSLLEDIIAGLSKILLDSPTHSLEGIKVSRPMHTFLQSSKELKQASRSPVKSEHSTVVNVDNKLRTTYTEHVTRLSKVASIKTTTQQDVTDMAEIMTKRPNVGKKMKIMNDIKTPTIRSTTTNNNTKNVSNLFDKLLHDAVERLNEKTRTLFNKNLIQKLTVAEQFTSEHPKQNNSNASESNITSGKVTHMNTTEKVSNNKHNKKSQKPNSSSELQLVPGRKSVVEVANNPSESARIIIDMNPVGSISSSLTDASAAKFPHAQRNEHSFIKDVQQDVGTKQIIENNQAANAITQTTISRRNNILPYKNKHFITDRFESAIEAPTTNAQSLVQNHLQSSLDNIRKKTLLQHMNKNIYQTAENRPVSSSKIKSETTKHVQLPAKGSEDVQLANTSTESRTSDTFSITRNNILPSFDVLNNGRLMLPGLHHKSGQTLNQKHDNNVTAYQHDSQNEEINRLSTAHELTNKNTVFITKVMSQYSKIEQKAVKPNPILKSRRMENDSQWLPSLLILPKSAIIKERIVPWPHSSSRNAIEKIGFNKFIIMDSTTSASKLASNAPLVSYVGTGEKSERFSRFDTLLLFPPLLSAYTDRDQGRSKTSTKQTNGKLQNYKTYSNTLVDSKTADPNLHTLRRQAISVDPGYKSTQSTSTTVNNLGAASENKNKVKITTSTNIVTDLIAMSMTSASLNLPTKVGIDRQKLNQYNKSERLTNTATAAVQTEVNTKSTAGIHDYNEPLTNNSVTSTQSLNHQENSQISPNSSPNPLMEMEVLLRLLLLQSMQHQIAEETSHTLSESLTTLDIKQRVDTSTKTRVVSMDLPNTAKRNNNDVETLKTNQSLPSTPMDRPKNITELDVTTATTEKMTVSTIEAEEIETHSSTPMPVDRPKNITELDVATATTAKMTVSTIEAEEIETHSSTPISTIEAEEIEAHSSTTISTIEAEEIEAHSSTPISTIEAEEIEAHSSTLISTIEAEEIEDPPSTTTGPQRRKLPYSKKNVSGTTTSRSSSTPANTNGAIIIEDPEAADRQNTTDVPEELELPGGGSWEPGDPSPPPIKTLTKPTASPDVTTTHPLSSTPSNLNSSDSTTANRIASKRPRPTHKPKRKTTISIKTI